MFGFKLPLLVVGQQFGVLAQVVGTGSAGHHDGAVACMGGDVSSSQASSLIHLTVAICRQAATASARRDLGVIYAAFFQQGEHGLADSRFDMGRVTAAEQIGA